MDLSKWTKYGKEYDFIFFYHTRKTDDFYRDVYGQFSHPYKYNPIKILFNEKKRIKRLETYQGYNNIDDRRIKNNTIYFDMGEPAILLTNCGFFGEKTESDLMEVKRITNLIYVNFNESIYQIIETNKGFLKKEEEDNG